MDGKHIKNTRGEMLLREHIMELRKRLIISLIAIGFGGCIGYIWYGSGGGFLLPLGELLRGPYCSLPPDLRANLSISGECRLLATKPFDMFLLRFKVGMVAGVVISSPVWIFQIWAYVAPGLYKKEKKFTAIFLFISAILFSSGSVLGYFVLDKGLEFLLGVGREFQVAAISGSDYYELVRNFVLLFGFSFEVPLLVIALNHFGILKYSTISGKRRIIWFFIFLLGAFISPGQEVLSMLALSLSVGFLLEVSFLYCMLNDRRKKLGTEAS